MKTRFDDQAVTDWAARLVAVPVPQTRVAAAADLKEIRRRLGWELISMARVPGARHAK